MLPTARASGLIEEHQTAMTLQELREHATALSQQVETEREWFTDALLTMDYNRALACQKRLERLEDKLSETSSRLYLRPDRHRLSE